MIVGEYNKKGKLMTSTNINLNLCDIEQILTSQSAGNTANYSQAQLNAMIQLAVCFQGGTPPSSSTDLQMFAAAINNVINQIFPGGTLPAGSSVATTQLWADLTYVDPATGKSLSQAAGGTNPGQALQGMQSDMIALYNDCINTSAATCWFVNGRDQSGVPAYNPDTDASLQNMLNQYMNQIGGIENALFNSPEGVLSPTNDPNLFNVEMESLNGLLYVIEGEAAQDGSNGYSAAINALFNQTLTLPGTSSPTSLKQLIANFVNPPSGETWEQAVVALQEGLYGSPPSPGNGQGISGTLYEYINQALNNGWGNGPLS